MKKQLYEQEVFTKLQETTEPEYLFDKAAGVLQIFYMKLLKQFNRTYNLVQSRKSNENVHISQKSEYKHQFT